jgi:hypothetical protein
MQGKSEEARAEYVRLFEAAEQELKKAYIQLKKEQMRHETLKSEYEASLRKKHELKMTEIQLFNEIETQKQRIITENKMLLTRAEAKYY